MRPGEFERSALFEDSHKRTLWEDENGTSLGNAVQLLKPMPSIPATILSQLTGGAGNHIDVTFDDIPSSLQTIDRLTQWHCDVALHPTDPLKAVVHISLGLNQLQHAFDEAGFGGQNFGTVNAYGNVDPIGNIDASGLTQGTPLSDTEYDSVTVTIVANQQMLNDMNIPLNAMMSLDVTNGLGGNTLLIPIISGAVGTVTYSGAAWFNAHTTLSTDTWTATTTTSSPDLIKIADLITGQSNFVITFTDTTTFSFSLTGVQLAALATANGITGNSMTNIIDTYIDLSPYVGKTIDSMTINNATAYTASAQTLDEVHSSYALLVALNFLAACTMVWGGGGSVGPGLGIVIGVGDKLILYCMLQNTTATIGASLLVEELTILSPDPATITLSIPIDAATILGIADPLTQAADAWVDAPPGLQDVHWPVTYLGPFAGCSIADTHIVTSGITDYGPAPFDPTAVLAFGLYWVANNSGVGIQQWVLPSGLKIWLQKANGVIANPIFGPALAMAGFTSSTWRTGTTTPAFPGLVSAYTEPECIRNRSRHSIIITGDVGYNPDGQYNRVIFWREYSHDGKHWVWIDKFLSIELWGLQLTTDNFLLSGQLPEDFIDLEPTIFRGVKSYTFGRRYKNETWEWVRYGIELQGGEGGPSDDGPPIFATVMARE